jgi:hypothetical protein
VQTICVAGVIYLARADGVMEVWDMLEASHQATATIPVAAVGLTSVAVNLSALEDASSSKSLIAIGELYLYRLPVILTTITSARALVPSSIQLLDKVVVHRCFYKTDSLGLLGTDHMNCHSERDVDLAGDENGVLHVMEVARKLRKETRDEDALVTHILEL